MVWEKAVFEEKTGTLGCRAGPLRHATHANVASSQHDSFPSTNVSADEDGQSVRRFILDLCWYCWGRRVKPPRIKKKYLCTSGRR
jgi:hypothetical protein